MGQIPDDIAPDVWATTWAAFWGGIADDMVEPSVVNAARLARVARALMAERERLNEAHRIISIYWDAIDLLYDGPDDSDVAHAQALLAGVQVTADPIAEAFRVRQALK